MRAEKLCDLLHVGFFREALLGWLHLQQEALMRTPYNSALTQADCKLAARWTITAAAAYGLILAGLLVLLLTSNGYADPDNPADHVSFCDIEGIAAPVSDTMQATELQSPAAAETDGFESRWMPAASNAPRAAVVSVPTEAAKAEEALVENGWDFTMPDSVPGFGSLPQAAAAPAAVPTTDGRKVTAQTQK